MCFGVKYLFKMTCVDHFVRWNVRENVVCMWIVNPLHAHNASFRILCAAVREPQPAMALLAVSPCKLFHSVSCPLGEHQPSPRKPIKPVEVCTTGTPETPRMSACTFARQCLPAVCAWRNLAFLTNESHDFSMCVELALG